MWVCVVWCAGRRGGVGALPVSVKAYAFSLCVHHMQDAGGMAVTDYGSVLVDLLFPWRFADGMPASDYRPGGPVLSMVGAVKDGVADAAVTHVVDVLALVQNHSSVLRNFVNKKITDVIGSVDGAADTLQNVLGERGGLLRSHTDALGEGIGGLHAALRGAVHQEVAETVRPPSAATVCAAPCAAQFDAPHHQPSLPPHSLPCSGTTPGHSG